jgi:hypothetical protein
MKPGIPEGLENLRESLKSADLLRRRGHGEILLMRRFDRTTIW